MKYRTKYINNSGLLTFNTKFWWRFLIFTILFLLIALFLISDQFSIFLYGMPFILENPEKYSHSSSFLKDSIEFTVNLNDPYENIGNTIYKSEQGYIEIKDIQKSENSFVIHFRSHGTYSSQNAVLISALKHKTNQDQSFTYSCEASLFLICEDTMYVCPVAGMSSVNHRDGDTFGFYILYENIEMSKEVGRITLVLKNITKNTWTRT